MIQEAYVSFETAKLLKEKGFDSDEVGCHGGFYSERCYESGHGIKTQSGQEVGIVYDDLTNSELEHDEYLRPTLQMAMKWLREVHGLHISLEPCYDYDSMHVVFLAFVQNVADVHEFMDGRNNVASHPNAEKSYELAIKYCLENLI